MTTNKRRTLPYKLAAEIGDAIPAERLGVAVSGGSDSVALLRLLFLLKISKKLELHVFHVDHGWRSDSAADAAWVRKLAIGLGLPCHIRRLKPPAGGCGCLGGREAWARKERFRIFSELSESTKVRFVALGHTADDQAETVLIRILRGTSIRGLGGMRPLRKMKIGGHALTFWRPMLKIGRERLRECLRELGQDWREDPTNSDETLLRNRVRRIVLPVLEKARPGAADHLRKLAGDARLASRFLASRCRKGLPEPGSRLFRISKREQSEYVQTERFRIWLSRSGLDEKISRAALGRVLDLARSPICGRRLPLGNLLVVRTADGLVLIDKMHHTAPPEFRLNGKKKIKTQDGTFYMATRPKSSNDEGVWIPKDLADKGLTLRGRHAADTFHPAGGNGGKKLARWMIDRKIPRDRRESILLVAQDSAVIWLPCIGRASSTSLSPKPGWLFLGRSAKRRENSSEKPKAPGKGA